MNAEGIGRALPPEWVQTTATGFLCLIVAFWLVAGLAALWRRTLWQRNGIAISAVAAERRGVLSSIWWGFAVALPDGWRIEWVMTIDGPVTRARKKKDKRVKEGWLDADGVGALISDEPNEEISAPTG